MERDRNVIFVIFSEGTKLTDFRGRYWRLAKRSPRLAWYLFWVWFASLVQGTPFRHVQVGDGEVLYDNSYRGATFLPWDRGIALQPRILGYYMVWTRKEIDQDLPVYNREKWWWLLPIPFLLMLCSRGIYQVPSCATECRKILVSAGLDIPRRKAWTPTQLHLWMSANGFDFLAEPPPTLGEPADSGAGQAEPASSS